MADKKISALASASTPLAGTEVLPIVQSGATVQVSVANLTAGRAVGSAGGTFTDNFVQGTAAKGINYTANTPAAGMTSQLLNWYEEGTWTPTQGSGLTVVGAFTSSGKYTRIGRQVTVYGQVNGAATVACTANQQLCAGLPFTSSGGMGAALTASNNSSVLYSSASSLFCSAASLGATASIYFSATYQI